MPDFVHQRHKPPTSLERPRDLVLVCAPLRSNINLSRIVRTASCCGVSRLIACGPSKIDTKVSRVTSDEFPIEKHRSLPPVLKALRGEGYQLVGLEQTTNSQNLHQFSFVHKTAIVVGNERLGLTEDALVLLDHVVEIPVYGLPYSYNVATATTMA
ncbi:MAG TPA: TrmH family RNA methyltransferase, partial [Pirellulaceae bacterium]|nr:TrmH family RNA methyltransferase [Pirellulaceae bacterium]